MIKVRIGGVPEHFNMPWHWAKSIGLFHQAHIEIEWTDYPAGTGAMNKALEAQELDMAVLLTEGAVAAIANGSPSKIVSWYVKSPLVWGIHVAANSTIQNITQIENKKYAVSRMGSGSHLMAYVDANQRNIRVQPEQFVVVNNLNGALQSLTNGESDIFFWEKFTTKPYVDNGTLRRVGECPTPWSCFVIVVRNDFFIQHQNEVKMVLNIIHNEASKFKMLPPAISLISARYALKPEDVNTWLKTIEWAGSETSLVNLREIENITNLLHSLGLIQQKCLPEDIIHQF